MEKIKHNNKKCKDLLNEDNISSENLILLLECRDKKLINFLLIDVREPDENRATSIVGTDVLFPLTKIQLYPDIIEQLRHEDVVFYCQTGSRTEYLLKIIKRMGFEKASHLQEGIITYKGDKTHNVLPPVIY